MFSAAQGTARCFVCLGFTVIILNKRISVKIRNLECKNYRGIRGCVRFDFAEHLNVFYGENGCGKSTILDAVATLLTWVANRVKTPNASGSPISESEIHNEEKNAFLMFQGDHAKETQDFAFQLTKTRRGYASEEKRPLRELKELTSYFRDSIASEQFALPLLAYYPINRAVVDIPARIRTKHDFDPVEIYDQSLTRAANFRLFFEWFQDCEAIENAKYRDTGHFEPHPHLNAVKEALSSFMPGFTDWRIRYKPMRMEVQKNGKTLEVNQLSAGEKCLMAMVGDIARRLAMGNPHAPVPRLGDGIVLIDEIELHLHPYWQRMIIGGLLDTFPNIQFFISTHSPQVIGEVFADANGHRIFHLRQTEEGIRYAIPEQAYGRDSNLILDGMMSSDHQELSRNASTSEKLREINRIIDEEQFSEAREQIRELEEKLGGTLPETVGAASLIHMLDDGGEERL